MIQHSHRRDEGKTSRGDLQTSATKLQLQSGVDCTAVLREREQEELERKERTGGGCDDQVPSKKKLKIAGTAKLAKSLKRVHKHSHPGITPFRIILKNASSRDK